MIRYLVDWPRNSKGEVILRNTHEALFYATMIKDLKVLVEEIEALRIIAKKDLSLEQAKPDGNPTRMIHLACKHQFYSECIETAQGLFREEG